MSARAALAAALLSFALVLSHAAPAAAVIVAESPDDICPPAENPCIVDEVVEVQPPGLLDFGGRTVRIVSGGRLEGEMDVRCGDLLVEVGASTVAIDTRLPNNVAGSLSLRARRSCSGDPSILCSDDVTCTNAGAGTCGEGRISFDGAIVARGNPGGTVSIMAAGDVVLFGSVRNDGTPAGAEGGYLSIDSQNGSVEAHGDLRPSANPKGTVGVTVTGGFLEVSAQDDIRLLGFIDVGHSHNGGTANFDAGGDIELNNGIHASAGSRFPEGAGGYLDFAAGGNITFTGSGAGQTTASRIEFSGSTGAYGGYYQYAGYGGAMRVNAESGDVVIAEQVSIVSNGGKKAKYGLSIGGRVYVYAYEGKVTLDGKAFLKGYTGVGYGGIMNLGAGYGLDMGPASVIDTRSKHGGSVNLYIGTGTANLQGKIDVRGKNLVAYSPYGYTGQGGYGYLRGYADVTFSGKFLAGAENGGGDIEMDVCRLDLVGNAVLDASNGAPGAACGIDLTIRESMTAAPSTQMLADAQTGGDVRIRYRDAAKPPQLQGTMKPLTPDLVHSPHLDGCPVCGNGEIDQGESCDDGNATSGDGCRDDCQDEGCIAATPGYPGVSLCDDGDACTVDACDADTHTCSNVASCEEGVACTMDACVAGTCEHTPVDAACDDHNDCTDDVCNATTGCVYAKLSDNPCEDGDLCTSAGTCAAGACVPSDGRYAVETKMTFAFKDGPDNDRLSFLTRLPVAVFASNPTVTGLHLEIRDGDHASVLEADLPASAFVDRGGGRYLFTDKNSLVGSANGVRKLSIVPLGDVAKLKLTVKDTELTGAADQFRMSVSLLFGTDPAFDDCVTARFVPCTPKGTKNKCKDV